METPNPATLLISRSCYLGNALVLLVYSAQFAGAHSMHTYQGKHHLLPPDGNFGLPGGRARVLCFIQPGAYYALCIIPCVV